MHTIFFPKMYRKLFLFFTVTFILISLFFWSSITTYFISIFYSNVQKSSFNEKQHYAAIIDAGSSGSRLFLYTWPTHSGKGEELLNIRPLLDPRGNPLSKKMTPGLSSFAENQDKVVEYMRQLLDMAAFNIPRSQHAETPLYVMATAGMRMISKESQQKILDKIRVFVKKNYKFLFSDSHAKVITGGEEGIYGWITTNYLLGRFNHNHTDGVPIVSVPQGNSPLRSQEVHHRKRTVGVIDMGGGSMQIAYELGADQSYNSAASKIVNLGCKETDLGHTYKLFVTTFLGFGANSARTRFERMLIRDTLSHRNSNTSRSTSSAIITTVPNRLIVDDPCLHPGLEMTSSVRLVNDSQGGLGLSNRQLKELPLINATFRGSGQYSDCKTKMTTLLDRKPCPNQKDKSLRCIMAGRLHPQMDLSNMHFYGFSEFWYSTNDVFELGGLYNYFKLNSKAIEHCKENWFSVILKEKKGVYKKADWPRLRYQCFKSAWITTVLHDGLGFPPTFSKFTSVMEVNGAEVQWTLGALLYQTRYFPLRSIEARERDRRREVLGRRGPSSSLRTGLLMVAVVMVAAVLVWMHWRHRLARVGAKRQHRQAGAFVVLDLGDRTAGWA